MKAQTLRQIWYWLKKSAEGIEVINKMFPGPEAKIVVEGLPTEPVRLNAESLKAQPLVLLPERILVPDPFMY